MLTSVSVSYLPASQSHTYQWIHFRRELNEDVHQCYLRMSASSQEGGDEYSPESSEIDTLGTVSEGYILTYILNLRLNSTA